MTFIIDRVDFVRTYCDFHSLGRLLHTLLSSLKVLRDVLDLAVEVSRVIVVFGTNFFFPNLNS